MKSLGERVPKRIKDSKFLFVLNLHQLHIDKIGISGMDNPKIICFNCNLEITVYYHEGYKGSRGKCPKCGVEFPLD